MLFLAADAKESLDLFVIIMTLLGGLALFLYGMEEMTDSLKIIAGARMKSILASLTSNRVAGVVSGGVVTAIVQSSSITTVLVVGFISAGLMSLTQAIPIIMGANIGTTITAQIVAFKVTKYALLIILIGFSFIFFTKNERIKHYGKVILGLGLVFFGMSVMSEATKPLRSYEPFLELMKTMSNPFTAVGIAAAFTAIVQSSSATTVVILVFAQEGSITLEPAIALAFGANIGTCVTALLAAIGKPIEAVRGAVVHVIFNVGGVLIWFFFIGALADGVTNLSNDVQRQIAHAHTIFNVANTVIFIGFVGPMASLVHWLVPDRKKKLAGDESDVELKYLDELLFDAPDLALDRVRRELQYMGEMVVDMFKQSKKIIIDGTEEDLVRLRQLDKRVDKVYSAIVDYLGHLSQVEITEKQSLLVHDYMVTANYMETIGDVVRGPFVYYGRQRLRIGEHLITFAKQPEFGELHDVVSETVAQSFQALGQGDHALADHVILEKNHVNHLADKAGEYLANNLETHDPERLNIFRTETDLVENLKRCYYYAKRISKVAKELDPEPVAADPVED